MSNKRRKVDEEIGSLTEWLAGLNTLTRATVHVNGPQHPTAVLVVDFGSPLKPQKLTHEQSAELAQRLRKAAKEIVGRDVNYRVSVDNSTGIHWVSTPLG